MTTDSYKRKIPDFHVVQRVNDEYFCSCGFCWGVNEEDPHPPVADQELKNIKEILSDSATASD